MTGACDGDLVSADIDAQAEDGGEVARGCAGDEAREAREDRSRPRVLRCVGERGRAKGCHRGRGPQAASGDVADDRDEAAVTDIEQAVPVAADLDPHRTRLIERRGLQVGRVGKSLGENRLLQRVRDLLLMMVELADLGAAARQARRERLGAPATLHQPIGQERRRQRQRQPHDRDDPRQSLEEPASERHQRGHDDRQSTVTERDRGRRSPTPHR